MTETPDSNSLNMKTESKGELYEHGIDTEVSCDAIITVWMWLLFLSPTHRDSATSPRFNLTPSSYWLGLAIKVNVAIPCENIATVYSCTSWGFPPLLWGLGHISNAQHFVTTSKPNICKSWWEHLLNSHANDSFSSFPDSSSIVFSCKRKFS